MIRTGYLRWEIDVEDTRSAVDALAREVVFRARPGYRTIRVKSSGQAAAADRFKQAVASDSDPEIIQQAWYQLAIVYRRLHRTEDSQKALAAFQKLKDEAAEHQQQLLERKRRAQGQGSTPPSDPPRDPSGR